MGNEIINKIENLIEAKKEEIINFALSCVKQLSENPPGDETAVANLMIKKAAEWGLREPKIWAEKKNRPNLLFSIKGRGKGKVLILLGHMDTKPIGDVSKWGVIDPYKPKIVGDKLYGRGSTDMKGAIVGMLAAAYAILHSKILLNGELILAFTADEEAGSTYGARYLVKKRLKADAIIIGEPSGEVKNFDTIGLAGRGVLLGKIVTKGTQMHSSLSDKGGCINASIKMAEVMVEFAKNLKKNLHYKPHYLYPDGPTISPGVTLNGGVFYGVIPGTASFGFDLRVIPGMTFQTLLEDIEVFLDKLMKKDKDLKVELILEGPKIAPWIPPVEISKDNPVVNCCINATKSVIGFNPKQVGVPFGTDASFIVDKLGIPTISSFGPGYIKLAHGPDEYVNVQAIIDSAKIYALTAVNYLNFF